MSGSLPASVLAGARASVKLTVAIEHTSGTPISGPVGAGVFLSTDDTLDAADVPLASSSKATKLRKGATHKEIKLVIRQFPSVPAGDYRVLVQATAAGATRSFEASRLSVAPPHVDLTASQLFATIRPSPRGGLALGGSILLGNDGNISAKGSVAVALFVSTDGTYDATDVPLGTATVRVGLKPGARKAAKFKLNSFLVLPSGGYTLVAILNANSQLAESNQTNNTVVGPTISV